MMTMIGRRNCKPGPEILILCFHFVQEWEMTEIEKKLFYMHARRHVQT